MHIIQTSSAYRTNISRLTDSSQDREPTYVIVDLQLTDVLTKSLIRIVVMKFVSKLEIFDMCKSA